MPGVMICATSLIFLQPCLRLVWFWGSYILIKFIFSIIIHGRAVLLWHSHRHLPAGRDFHPTTLLGIRRDLLGKSFDVFIFFLRSGGVLI